MQVLCETLYSGKHLNQQQMEEFAQGILDGSLSESQLGAALVAMKINGVSTEELAALAKVMQKNAIQIPNAPKNAMDNCGTGGDHSNSFNISTTAAFVLAAGGIPMAKHGNRSISSRSGSADVLELLGVNITATPEKISELLHTVGIAFLFAPALHTGMKSVMKIRQELATPTIFNLLGPLINPVRLESQLMGTYAGETLTDTASVLGSIGRKRGIVVHGFGGMDEANLAGVTQCAMYSNGVVSEFSFTPEEFGFTTTPIKAIVGKDAARNAEILLSVLKNQPSVYLETVVLNAGLGFYANGKVACLEDGFAHARRCLATGSAYDKLQQLLAQQ